LDFYEPGQNSNTGGIRKTGQPGKHMPGINDGGPQAEEAFR
jgi:hypothetical protein